MITGNDYRAKIKELSRKEHIDRMTTKEATNLYCAKLLFERGSVTKIRYINRLYQKYILNTDIANAQEILK